MCNRLHTNCGELDMATIRDVAALAKVSVATVSRVLNKKGYVNSDTEREVLRAMDLLQYVPNSVARVLAGKKMSVLALVIPDISNPFFPELARGVEDAAQELGYNVFLCNSDNLAKKEKAYVDILTKRSIDGIIFATSSLSQEEVDEVASIGIPVVVMDRVSVSGNCSVIRVDNGHGVRLAVNHLLEIGCRKIAHIHGPTMINTAKERLLAYEEAVQTFDWYTPSLMEEGGFHIEGGRAAVRKLLTRHPDIDGIFAGNDLMAIGALKELRSMGVAVPEQVAVCGFDGIQLAGIIDPELSTIAQPIYEMGALASRTIIEQIEKERQEYVAYELDVKFIERESTRRRGAIT